MSMYDPAQTPPGWGPPQGQWRPPASPLATLGTVMIVVGLFLAVFGLIAGIVIATYNVSNPLTGESVVAIPGEIKVFLFSLPFIGGLGLGAVTTIGGVLLRARARGQ